MFTPIWSFGSLSAIVKPTDVVSDDSRSPPIITLLDPPPPMPTDKLELGRHRADLDCCAAAASPSIDHS
jgi:hypothetical protein